MDGYRYVIVFLVFLGIVITYMLRVNLSVALICMVNHTAMAMEGQTKLENSSLQISSKPKKKSDMCKENEKLGGPEDVPDKDGEFLWDQRTRSLILSSFYYGYVITELPGGWLAYKFGGKWVFGLGILSTSVFTLATPFSVHLKLTFLICLRILEGIGEGVTFPCVHALFAHWIPPLERCRMPGIIYAAMGVGTVIGFSLAARLCDTAIGWPLVFYIFGGIALIWVCLWIIFGSSSPSKSRWISDGEKKFINDSLSATVSKEHPSFRAVPWLKIFSTPAMWAIWASHTAASWGYFTLLTLLPTYFRDVLHTTMTKNGIFSALPYICFTVVAIFMGPICDYVLKKKWLSVVVLRKVVDSIGHVVPGLFLLIVTTIGCNVTAAVAIMCIAVGSEGLVGIGSAANNLDVAGRFAGITHGISNTFGSIAGFIAPLIAGAITEGDVSIARWRIVFGIAAGIYWISSVIYISLAKGEPAPWARVGQDETPKDFALAAHRD